MYYPSSENKGADQLRGYREADLRLCLNFAYADCWFSHEAAHIMKKKKKNSITWVCFRNETHGKLQQNGRSSLSLMRRTSLLTHRGKTNNVVSEQVRHKAGCTSTEAG